MFVYFSDTFNPIAKWLLIILAIGAVIRLSGKGE